MNILIIYLLAFSILVFIIFLAVRTIMKIRSISTNKEKDKNISKIDVQDEDLVFKLQELKKMHHEGTISKQEFKLAKEKLLKKK